VADEPTQTPAATETPVSPPTSPSSPSESGGGKPTPAEQPEGSQPARERGPDGKFAPKTGGKPAEGEPPQAAADPYAALAVPDGLEVDPDVLADAKSIFAELKIAPEKAQELVNLQARVEQKRLQDQIEYQKTLTELTKNDPEFGGLLKWPVTESKLAAIRSHVGSKFIDALNAQGLGNHPEVIRGLIKLHDAAGLSEDRLVPGARAPTAGMSAVLYPNTPQMRD
jgi:hypothetical protein